MSHRLVFSADMVAVDSATITATLSAAGSQSRAWERLKERENPMLAL
jgi:hypothetical protein